LDTCHFALQFENLEDSLIRLKQSDIAVSKVQVSSALHTTVGGNTKQVLAPFCDEVYLHEVKIRDRDGSTSSFPDLPEALDSELSSSSGSELRSHFHVPLYFEESEDLRSTSFELTPAFFQTALQNGISHFEMETYTFDVLPEALRSMDVVQSISKEYQWVKAKLLQ
jgi:hypothetical protein